MLSHVFIGVSDFDRAYRFYGELLGCLDLEPRFCERSHPWAGWQGRGGGRPLLLIGRPFDGQAHDPGNGQMVALQASHCAFALIGSVVPGLASRGRVKGIRIAKSWA